MTRRVPWRPPWRLATGVAVALACPNLADAQIASAADSPRIAVRVEQLDAGTCSGSFVAHRLPHQTRGASERIGFFASNGAGVALADLDDDGLIDIVLTGLEAPTQIFWNLGDLELLAEALPTAPARAVNAVDADGDGQLDLVFTHPAAMPSLWRGVDAAGDPGGATGGTNGRATTSRATARRRADGIGRPRFARVADDELRAWFPAYAIAWADLDRDGDLDLVGASYDAELGNLTGSGVGGGAFYYENEGGRLAYQRLTGESYALAVHLSDLDGDGHRDIIIGNDFAVPDVVLRNGIASGDGFTVIEPFVTTTTNTMSFAEGDVDGDGRAELLATDMKPVTRDAAVDDAWGPLWRATADLQPDDGVQITANMLQSRGPGRGSDAVGGYRDRAGPAGVDATGWSWSAQFGDLDNDGHLDLYVVNGMIAEELFAHLPGDELVEQNQALRNDGTGRFVPSPEWGLGATASGRGMALADLDNDGDLDVVVNNLAAPAVLFENRLCGGASVQVALRQPGTANSRAIGARLRLHAAADAMSREIRASSGYLSSDPARAHFGVGDSATADLHQLEVMWPDGAVTRLPTPRPGTLITIEREAAAN